MTTVVPTAEIMQSTIKHTSLFAFPPGREKIPNFTTYPYKT